MDLIKTSMNKNHFILKKSQRTVEVVLTLCYFVNTYLASNQNKNKYKQKLNRKEILERIISFQDIFRNWWYTCPPRSLNCRIWVKSPREKKSTIKNEKVRSKTIILRSKTSTVLETFSYSAGNFFCQINEEWRFCVPHNRASREILNVSWRQHHEVL